MTPVAESGQSVTRKAEADDGRPAVSDSRRRISASHPRALSGTDLTVADVVVTMGCGDACPTYPGKAAPNSLVSGSIRSGVVGVPVTGAWHERYERDAHARPG